MMRLLLLLALVIIAKANTVKIMFQWNQEVGNLPDSNVKMLGIDGNLVTPWSILSNQTIKDGQTKNYLLMRNQRDSIWLDTICDKFVSQDTFELRINYPAIYPTDFHISIKGLEKGKPMVATIQAKNVGLEIDRSNGESKNVIKDYIIPFDLVLERCLCNGIPTSMVPSLSTLILSSIIIIFGTFRLIQP